MLQTTLQKTVSRKKLISRERFRDEGHFLRSWLERPLMTGAVMPSGKMLARAMASYADPSSKGHVLELGPGTGPVTEALLRHGITQDRLVLVEFNPDFCRLLRRRFPKATIIEGDAYNLQDSLSQVLQEPLAATISSLPLFNQPLELRKNLLATAQDYMKPDAPFVQFTYAVVPPIPREPGVYSVEGSPRIWLNLPPARVWVYRRPSFS